MCNNLDVCSTYFYSLTTQTLFWAIFGLIDLKNFELTNILESTEFFHIPVVPLCNSRSMFVCFKGGMGTGAIAGAYFIGVTHQLVTYTIWSKTS